MILAAGALKHFLACLGLIFLLAWSHAQVVINEVCYDPSGADGGKEWIELYNSGNTDVNLAGAKLLSGGSEFGEVFTFPHFILR
ncbi:MAG: lamin tail domain-containing protein, partial [Candidatus Cloacimonetes bacterium]|nr:lamin tail domain-containing protein [Candidatus Cloacimonadota bacterium]